MGLTQDWQDGFGLFCPAKCESTFASERMVNYQQLTRRPCAAPSLMLLWAFLGRKFASPLALFRKMRLPEGGRLSGLRSPVAPVDIVSSNREK